MTLAGPRIALSYPLFNHRDPHHLENLDSLMKDSRMLLFAGAKRVRGSGGHDSGGRAVRFGNRRREKGAGRRQSAARQMIG